MPDPQDFGLGKETHRRFESLVAAIREARTERELTLYGERFAATRTEARQYFSLVERELAEKLRELRTIEGREQPVHVPSGPSLAEAGRRRHRLRSRRLERLSPARLNLISQYLPELHRPWPRSPLAPGAAGASVAVRA